MNIKPAKRMASVQEYYFSTKLREVRERQSKGEHIVNLGIGSPDLPPHPDVIEVLKKEISEIGASKYQSYQGIPQLRRAFRDYYKNKFDVSLDAESELLCLIGAKEGVMHLSMSLLQEKDQVLVPNPGYGSYAACARLTGAEIVEYNLLESNGWLPDIEELELLDLTHVKMMWVNYPNMPTGVKGNKTLFEDLISFGKRHEILICNDNPYAFILNDQPMSILSIPGAMDTACELNSLSKSHNMAGWRVGVLAGHKDLLNIVIRFKSNMDSGMFKPIQMAAAKALSLGEEWYQEQNQAYRARQDAGMQLLRMLGCNLDRPESGMFIWAKAPSSFKNGESFSTYLMDQYGLFIPPGIIFGSSGDAFIRISLCTPLTVFEEVIQSVQEKIQAHV